MLETECVTEWQGRTGQEGQSRGVQMLRVKAKKKGASDNEVKIVNKPQEPEENPRKNMHLTTMKE